MDNLGKTHWFILFLVEVAICIVKKDGLFQTRTVILTCEYRSKLLCNIHVRPFIAILSDECRTSCAIRN